MKKLSILIVENDQTSIRYLSEIFDENFDIKIANSGERTLQLLADYIPDLILLEVVLPGIDGFEVCRQVRANNQLDAVKIIMQSAKAMQRDIRRGLESGANAYITKPYDHETLIEKVMGLNR